MRNDPDFAAYHAILATNYQASNYDNSVAGRMMRSGHQYTERKFTNTDHFSRVLELGAGSGVHLAYIQHGFDEYILSDNSSNMLEQLEKLAHKNYHASKISISLQDATQPAYPAASIDRIIATHLLEHLHQPHKVLRNWYDLLQNKGVLTLLLPCDPGLAWRFGRMLGPRRQAEKLGIAYDYWMAREHVNAINNLVAMIHYYFDNIQESWWPLLIPSMDINLFYVCHITKS